MTHILAALLSSGHRRQLITPTAVLALAVMLTAGMIIWAVTLRATTRLEHESQTAAWDANSAVAEEISSTAASLPEQLNKASALRASGFAAAADRVVWVERTLTLLRRIQPPTYSVVAEPALAQALPEALQTWYSERSLEAPQFEVNDLVIQTQGMVEAELLQVLKEAVIAGGAVVRLEHCKLTRRADNSGIDAECRLRRYSLKKVPAESPS
jgi:hypothetical protein